MPHDGSMAAGVLAQQYQGRYYGAPGLDAAGYPQQAQRQGQAVGGAAADDWQQQSVLLQEQQRQRQLAAVLGFEQVRLQVARPRHTPTAAP